MALAQNTRKWLLMQGFACDADSAAVAELQPWLRVTPGLSTFWILVGTALQSPAALWAFSLIAALGALSRYHLFDVVFNQVMRRVVEAPPLPPNPAPRRFAMGAAALWSAIAGALFAADHALAGLLAGLSLGMAGLTVTLSHFCLGSWIFRRLTRT